jgi:hypothetical protein
MKRIARTQRRALAVALGSFGLFAAAPAWAQRPPAPEGIRADPHTYETPQNFALELRFGPYEPEVDSDPDLAGRTPYAASFGDKPRLMFGVELDWQALRIPHVGTLGPGVGISTTSATRPAYTQTGLRSSEDMSFSVTPFTGLAVFRVDVFQRDAGVPLVPYAKAGFVYALWHASTTAGTSTFTRPDGTVERGRGGTWGVQGALGLSFDLGTIDSHSARQLDQATGINHTYLFGEYMISKVDGVFGQSRPMHVGDSTWTVGLSFDF